MKRICIIGISGKLGQYMARHALDQGLEVRGVCRPESLHKLADLAHRITVFPGRTDDREVVAQAVEGCDGVLTVLAPMGVQDYSSGTARAVLDLAPPEARLAFSCGLHIRHSEKDRISWKLRAFVAVFGFVAKLARFADISDQVRATDAIFASDRDWTVVRAPDLEEGPSEGLPLWAPHAGDPLLKAGVVRRTDFGLFMLHALSDPDLIRVAPVIVSRVRAAQIGGDHSLLAA
ncbi:NAD(P)-dependent oxidoreductase [Thalassococcus sp. BH17M4-6]|uniref:NAD(P)-dependent oxidoreductase n=1 Tax=Thalassococcus sp. BH17M4-6 TaxID=3413148 RepID=UPI003BD6BCDB